MKTAIVYYSNKGTTKRYCKALTENIGADLYEIKAAKEQGMFLCLLTQCPMAIRQKTTKIKTKPIDLTGYDKILIASPMWAGYPAPVFNNIVEMLPSGKEVEIIVVSGSGTTKPAVKEKVTNLVNKTGSVVVGYRDVLNTTVV